MNQTYRQKKWNKFPILVAKPLAMMMLFVISMVGYFGNTKVESLSKISLSNSISHNKGFIFFRDAKLFSVLEENNNSLFQGVVTSEDNEEDDFDELDSDTEELVSFFALSLPFKNYFSSISWNKIFLDDFNQIKKSSSTSSLFIIFQVFRI